MVSVWFRSSSFEGRLLPHAALAYPTTGAVGDRLSISTVASATP